MLYNFIINRIIALLEMNYRNMLKKPESLNYNRSISGDETKNIVIYLYESGIEQEFIDLELDIPTVISILKKEHNNNIYKGVSKRREIEFPFIGFNMYVILGCHS
jgi:hypothetical protein